MTHTNELYGVIAKYDKKGKSGHDQVLRIVKAYSDPEVQLSRFFFSHKAHGPTVYRGLSLLAPLIALQTVIKKPLYLPGIGLFEPTGGGSYEQGYDFSRMFDILPFGQREKQVDKDSGEEKNFTSRVMTDRREIDFALFDQYLFGKHEKRPTGKYVVTLLENNISKAHILEESLSEHYGGVRSVLTEPYSGPLDAQGIAAASEGRPESLAAYLKGAVDLSNIAYNPKLLEDILWVIGYLEATGKYSD